MIPGNPIPKKRPRFFHKRLKNVVYDQQKQETEFVKAIFQMQKAEFNQIELIAGPVKLEMYFYTKIPVSWSQKKKDQSHGQMDTRRPDLDNYIKFYADAMNMVIFKDDNQIVELESKKIFSKNPRTEIVVIELPEVRDAI